VDAIKQRNTLGLFLHKPMFVTYKNSKVAGYTKVAKGGETQGGGWLYGPDGGGYGVGPCGEQCQWDGGKSPKDNRSTYAEMYTISNGFCAYSRSDNCNRAGYCAVGAGKGAGVASLDAKYASYTSSASVSKVTCVDGLTSTQGNSENPYTKTAELACTTSKNSGKDVPFLGALGTTTQDCYYQTPVNPVSLYAGGPNFPAVLDSAATGTWCSFYDENGVCNGNDTPNECTGCIVVQNTGYDGCGKADVGAGPLPSYKTVDPCPIYYEPDCEYAYILSKAGSYIGIPKNIGPFLSVSAVALSTDKAVEFNIESGKELPKSGDTFAYNNNEVTLKELGPKDGKSFTNSYLYFEEAGLKTTTYKFADAGYTSGKNTITMFYSNEAKATVTAVAEQALDPCCTGDGCPENPPTIKTTDTLFAGKSYIFTHCKMSTTAVGEYFAYQPTTITRKEHLAWGEFGYSTSVGSNYQNNYQAAEEHECASVVIIPGVGTIDTVNDWPIEKCFNCVGGMVPVNYWSENPEPGTAKCGGINCGCAGTDGPQTTAPAAQANVTAQTQCYDPCVSQTPCTQLEEVDVGLTFEPGVICCQVQTYYVETRSTKTLKNEINRTGNCAAVDKMSYDVAYTHLTIAQTATTGIGGGFLATAQKSEGLYYLDSKGSVKTATSYSLKQSKSDITDSHVYFAFNGAYYNPMGKTTQFGSDGAKKTFIALATGDATYLVGSPDGKSKGNNSTVSHDGDVHSYYISDPTAKIWNQASWPGHGVVNGKITTGTFSFSFNTGAFANTYVGGGGEGRFSPGAKQTIVADGGLVLISSKGNASEKSFKTTYSTAAFSTSFDSTFKGAWIAKAIPYTYASTRSVGLNPNPYAGIETNHVFSINCPGCNFPQPATPIPLIGDSTAYFIKGDKSLLYNNNATSYLWTHPAFKKKWGDGHGAECEEE
jgi:hypothetical protein